MPMFFTRQITRLFKDLLTGISFFRKSDQIFNGKTGQIDLPFFKPSKGYFFLVPPTALPPPASGLAFGGLLRLQLGRGLLVGRPEVGQPFVVLRHNVVHPDNQVVKGVIVECVHVYFGSNWHLHKSGKAAKGHSSQKKCCPHPKPSWYPMKTI